MRQRIESVRHGVVVSTGLCHKFVASLAALAHGALEIGSIGRGASVHTLLGCLSLRADSRYASEVKSAGCRAVISKRVGLPFPLPRCMMSCPVRSAGCAKFGLLSIQSAHFNFSFLIRFHKERKKEKL